MNKTQTAIAALFSLCIGTSAFADSCDPAKVGATNSMNVTIDGKETEIRQAMVALGTQNTEVAKQLISQMQDAINTIEKNRGRASSGAGDEAFLQCKKNQIPLQTAIDLGVVYATGGLAVLLPPKAWHIDAGDIASGNILGGNCSFVRNPLGHGC
ncbi:hypothetical protein B0G75_105466 [Paraburkholderia sp. BL18I3N2]|uniref:hypothetical protein n=1 Tax=Paraburkholderia sp. BL18I3N2 TaxID=1938799 RepID=UPI000D06F281|nr:hypothetical protein [Paraburkholderia sp. BL18I3N2]PRX31676.1 hypothetical protein B0G75_105466 [Paraburkholderia sp. BL18I3N2]